MSKLSAKFYALNTQDHAYLIEKIKSWCPWLKFFVVNIYHKVSQCPPHIILSALEAKYFNIDIF